jgi:MFS family permease
MQSFKFASYFGGIGHALSARDYRIYWYGHVFSSHGVWMHRMAVGVLIFQLTDSPAWLGFIGFVYSVPLMILGPIAGAIADRIGIRLTAIIAIVASILVTCLMAILTLNRTMTPELVAASMIVLGFLHAFDFPVRQVLIQLLVGRDRMAAAIALNSTTFYTASFTGPMLCAAVLALGRLYVGDAAPGIVFLIYGLTMAILLAAILATRMRDQPTKGAGSAKLLEDVLAGLCYTLNHEGMRLVLVLSICVSLFARPFIDLLPGYALAVFDHGTDGVGIMIAASGIGALCFSVYMALRGRTEGLTRILIIFSAAGSAALVVFSGTLIFWFAAIAMAVVGGSFVVMGIASQSLIQHITNNEFLARVISVFFALTIGAQAIGVLVIGWIAEVAGFRVAFGSGAALSLLVVLIVGPGLWRRARELEEPEAEFSTSPVTESAIDDAKASGTAD